MDSKKNMLSISQQGWLTHWLTSQRISTPELVELLAGDGSTRKFFRLHFSGAAPKTLILLSDPDWIFSKDYPAHQAYLAAQQLPVPKFLVVNPQLGTLVMEDVGDEYLQYRLAKEKNPAPFWEAATKLIAHFHGKTYPVPPALPGAQRRFDRQKLADEMKFTVEHLTVGFLGLAAPSPEAWNKIEVFCETLASYKPWVLCHRDYHSRNLMVHEEELVLIDFQDARLGPPQYDLASLLYDAYAPLDDKNREHLTQLYLDTLAKYAVVKEISVSDFRSHLRAVAFQRLLKAAGSFASFFTRYKKTSHLSYLIPSLSSALKLQHADSFLEPLFPTALYLDTVKEKLKALATESHS